MFESIERAKKLAACNTVQDLEDEVNICKTEFLHFLRIFFLGTEERDSLCSRTRRPRLCADVMRSWREAEVAWSEVIDVLAVGRFRLAAKSSSG